MILEAMARAYMLYHGGNPDKYDWQGVFAGVDTDKVFNSNSREDAFNLVRSRVDALLKENKHA